tara:strand:+ start:101 stop:754 length:654 start_codon:yes stop_codon:yes gene_type:complete
MENVNMYYIVLKTLQKLGVGKVYKSNEDYKFLKEILKRHPKYKNKIGAGIKHLRVKMTHIDNTKYELQVARKDKISNITEYVSFDWETLAKGYIPKEKDQVRQACREAIWTQCHDFKLNSQNDDDTWTCNNCNKICYTTKEIQTDHLYPFSFIVNDFKNTRPYIPKEFDKHSESNETRFRNNDFVFKNDFIEYHQEHAKYQMLCKSCNGIKGTKLIN